MRLDLERSGGLVARTLHWSLDVDTLDPARRDEVQELLAQARAAAPEAPGSGADRFSYRLVADAPGGAPLELRLSEPLSEPARRLLSLIRTSSA